MLYFALNQLSYIRKLDISSGEKRRLVREVMKCHRVKAAFKDMKMPNVSGKLKLAIRLVKYRLAFIYMFIYGRKR